MIKYIVIEGIHGSGKSSVAKALTKTLQEKGVDAHYLHFPDEEDMLGQVIRQTLADGDLVRKREVLGLLYAAATNRFHIRSKNDNKIYVLERDAVTTGLIFQRDIPREVRLEIYKYGIQSLQERGKVFYVNIDKGVALERLKKRNEELMLLGWVWKDKAEDKFVTEEFDRLSDLYENEMFPQLDKLGLQHEIVDNSWTVEETIQQILEKLEIS